MKKRPPGIYVVALWILFASFSVIRPLLIRETPFVQTLSPKGFGMVLIAAFALIIVEATCLVHLRRTALWIAVIICSSWTVLMFVKIVLALRYSPQIFSATASGIAVYVAPLAAMIVNAWVLLYLKRLMS